MRSLPGTLLSVLLLLAIPVAAQPVSAPPAKSNATQSKKQRPMPKAEWLDPDRGAPNGTEYRTFASAVLGREVSYLVWLPPGYAEDTKRYPAIYWLHGMGGNHAYEIVPGVAHEPPRYFRELGATVFAFHAQSLGGASATTRPPGS